MAAAAAAATALAVEVRSAGPVKGKGLFAVRDFQAGETILVEEPIVSAQFSWNKLCKYRACDFCLKSLETAQEMARRLSGIADVELPQSQCCQIDKSAHCVCPGCEVEYCSEQCRDRAFARYHSLMCTRGNPDHLLLAIDEAWRNMHHPPETTSVTLCLRILTQMLLAPSEEESNKFDMFCRDYQRVHGEQCFQHKLLDPQFSDNINTMQALVETFFSELQHPNIGRIRKWVALDGFRSLLAMIGTNGAGIGTSSIAAYDRVLTALPLPEAEKAEIEEQMNSLYEVMQDVSGGFLDCEGSGLFETHSACNHSCEPNAESRFLNNDFTLHLTAKCDIVAGQEILISYIDDPLLKKSRNFRQKYLRENYLFECVCQKCHSQEDEPDRSDSESCWETDDEEADEVEEDDEVDEDGGVAAAEDGAGEDAMNE
eukprot:m.87129 g.87129  ORF g.87129 m.87129 type:complete len:428 (-) comp18005_c0_seq1:37-1320(-)